MISTKILCIQITRVAKISNQQDEIGKCIKNQTVKPSVASWVTYQDLKLTENIQLTKDLFK